MTPELTTVMMFLSLLILLAGFPIAICIRRFERPARVTSRMTARGNHVSALWRQSAVAAAIACVFAAGQAQANGTDPTVVAGQASFSTLGSSLNITNSPGAIINWHGFSIAASETTRFIQQNAASSVLNRVIGPDPSLILGTLTSNGRVFLINPSGILFGQGARIDVAGLVASTLNLSNQDFLAGRLNFASNPLAGNVENQGSITTPSGGSVYLVGSNVTNSGIINSPQGDVILAAGQSVKIFDSSTPGVRVELTASDNAAVNLGEILAQSGEVGIYGAVLRNTGIIDADQVVRDASGKIVLRAKQDVTLEAGSRLSANGEQAGEITVQSETGTTLVSGTIEAKGTGSPPLQGENQLTQSPPQVESQIDQSISQGDGQLSQSPLPQGEGQGEGGISASSSKGGTIKLLGNRVGLTAASVDVSGIAGGGTVLVGGDYQGTGAVQRASATYMSADSTITADAITNGSGGKVVLWANDSTRAYGSITACGGAQEGDGGLIETSGRWLDVAGINVSASAANGMGGTWLLDPNNIEINGAGPQTIFTPSPNFTSTDDTAILLNTSIQTALNAGTSVVVTTGTGGTNLQLGDITVASTIAWSHAAGPTLTLNATNDVIVNAGATITATTGSFVANAGGNVNIAAATKSTTGNLTFTAGNDVNLTAPTTIVTGNLTANAGHDVNVSAAMTITGGNVVLRADNDGTGPGAGGGTVNFSGVGGVTITSGLASIYYNPSTYATPTAYSSKFSIGTGTLSSYMWVFAQGNNKVYDGTNTATLSFKGTPTAGGDVTLIDPGSGATFSDKNAAVGKTVTYFGFTLGGGDSGKFSLFGDGSGTATATITKLDTNVSGSRVYDASTNAAGADLTTVSSLIAGDTVTVGGTGSVANKNVAVNKAVTNLTLALAGADAGNYNLLAGGNTLSITKLDTNVSGSRVYDASTNAAGADLTTVSSLIAGDTVTVGGTGSVANKNVAVNKAVTNLTLALAGADAGNYNLLAGGNTLSITKLDTNVSGSRVYDASTNAAGADLTTVSSLIAGDTVTVGGTGSVANKNVAVNKAVTNLTLALAGADAGNYNLLAGGNTLSITKLDTNVSGSRVYDASTNAAGADLTTVSSLIAGDTVTVGGTGSVANKNVAVNKAVTNLTLALAGADAGNYNLLAGGNTLSITKLDTNVSGSRVYDASTNAAGADLTTVSSLIAGDTVTVGGTGSVANKNVAVNKAVTNLTLALAGADAGNYNLLAGGNTLSITKLDTNVSGSRVYDASTNAAGADLTTVSSLIAGDTVTVGGTGSVANKNVAVNKAVTNLTLALAGADAGNYNLLAGGNTLSITKLDTNVSGSRVYDASTNAAGADLTTVSSLIAGDTVTVGGTGSVANKNVAVNKAVTNLTLALAGADAGNYNLLAGGNTLSITKLDTNVSGSRVYDASTNAAGADLTTVSSLIAGDTVTVGGTGSVANKNVAVNKAVTNLTLALAGADAGNYNLLAGGNTLSITKLDTNVSGSRVYDASTNAAGADLTTVSSLIAGDTVTVGGTGSVANKNVAVNKAVTNLTLALAGADAGNYNLLAGGNTLSITKLDTNVSGSRVYDASTNAAGADLTTVSSLIAGDTVTVGGTGSVANKNVAVNKAVTNLTLALAGADAGNYNLLAGGNTLSITKLDTNVSGSRVYDASTNAAGADLTTVSSLIAGDTVTVGGTGSVANKNVAVNKAVTNLTLALAGADAGNYNLLAGGNTLSITKLDTNVSGSRVYDASTNAAGADLTTVSSLIAGDTVTVGGTGSVANKNVAVNKAVTNLTLALAGADAGNYNLLAGGNTLSITKLDTNVSGSRVYDASTNAAGADLTTVSSLIAGDTVTVGGTGSVANKNVAVNKAVTNLTLALAGADAGNYNLLAGGNTLSITKLDTNVSGSRVYDASTNAAGADLTTVSSLIAGDTVTVGGTGSVANKNVAVNKAVTNLTLALAGADAGNYNLLAGGNTLSITKLDTNVSGSRVYDASTNAAGADLTTVSSLIAGDTVTVGGTGSVANKNVAVNKAVTNLTLALAGADAGNYNLLAGGNTLSITKLDTNVSGSRVYDASTNAAGADLTTVSSLIAGDTVTVGGTGSVANKNVAVNKAVTNLTLALAGADAGNYNLLAGGNTLSITKLDTNVSGSRVYDASTNAAGADLTTVSSLIAGDTVTVGGTGSVANKNVAVNKAVTNLTLALAGADAGNYNLLAGGNTLSITKLDTNVSGSRVYDASTNAAGADLTTVSSLIAGDTVTVGGTGSVANKNVAVNKAVTNLTLALAGADAGNYNLLAGGNTLSITKLDTNVSGSRVYDASTNAAGADLTTVSSLIAGDTVTVGGTGSVANKNVAVNKAVTNLTLALAGADAGNYNLLAGGNTLSITKLDTNVSGSRVYDASTNAAGADLTTVSSLIAGDTVTVGGTGSVANKNVAVNKAVTNLTLALAGADAGNYNLLAGGNTLSITKSPLTLSASNVTKTYDGNTSAASTAIVTSGTLYDSLTGGAFAFTSKDVGLGNKTVTVSNVTVNDGNGGGNYAVTYANNTTSTITALGITGSITAANKTYDATTAATITGRTLAGVIGGDVVSYIGGTALFSDKNVANGKTVTGTGLSLSGAGAGNYTVNSTATTTANITALGITGSITAANKTYDATTAATITGRTLAGVIGGDVVSYTGGSALFSDKNVANGKTVTGTGLSLSGADAGNYTVNTAASTTANITPAALGIAANSTSKTYGDTVSFTGTEFSSTGLKNAETIGSVSLASAGAASTAGVAGSPYDITASAATGGTFSAGNYTISYVGGALGVIPAALGIAANSTSKTYGSTVSFTGSEFSSTGLKNGETVGSVSLASAGAVSTAGVAGSPYDITASAATGGTFNAGNYTISYVDGALGVIRAALGIAANAAAKTYNGLAYGGGNGVTYAGFQGTDTAASLTGVLAYGGSSQGAVNVGNYAIIPSGQSSPNYTIAYVNGKLSVTPAPLGIAANSATRLYGDANPAFSATYTGFQNGETPAALTGTLALATPAIPTSNVGNYAIIPSGQSSTNYTIAYVNGKLSVTRAALGIAANSTSKTYGDTVSFTGAEFSSTGLKNAETIGSVSLASAGGAATAGVAGSPYEITASAAAGGTFNAGNYTISYVDGALGVIPAALGIAANSTSKTYGSTVSFTGSEFSSTGLKNGETVGSVSLASAGAAADAGVDGSPYEITASAAIGGTFNAGNYTISYVDGALGVIPAGLLGIAANSAAKIYDGLAYSGGNGVSYTGFKVGDTPASLDGTLVYGGSSQAAVNVGNYVIIPSGQSSPNYTIAYVNGKLSVTPAPLGIAAHSATRLYGDVNPAFSATYTGFQNGETPAALTGALALATPAIPTSNVGNYAIIPSGQSSTNYTIAYVNGKLSVTPAPLGIAANSTSKTYGDTVSFTGAEFSSTGLKNAETIGSVSLASAGAAPTAGVAGSPYDITASAATGGSFNAGNYTISYADGALGVIPAPLGIAANSTSKTYGSTVSFIGTEFSSTGLKNAETIGSVSLASVGAVSTAGVAGSPYDITASAAIGGSFNAGDYTISYVDGALGVIPAPLGIAANAAAKTYNGLAYSGGNGVTYTGFKVGDTAASLTGMLAYGGSSQGAVNVGNYAIIPSGQSSTNYTIAYVNGKLSVTPAPLGIAANSATRLYGDANPAFSATYTGFQNGETPAALTGALALATPAIPTSNVGNYAIIPSGQSSTNYTIAYVNGKLGVTPVSLMVTADAKSKVYGTSDPALTFNTAGLVNNPALGVVDTAGTVLSGALTRAGGETVPGGPYAITQGTLAANSNYTLSSFTGNDLTITPAPLNVAANAQSKVYGTSDPALTFGTTGLVNNPALGIADTTGIVLSGALTRVPGETVLGGPYAITQGTLAANNSNYTLGFSHNNLTITPAAVNVAANPQSKLFGQSDPVLTYSVTGLVNNPALHIADTEGAVISGALTRVPGESALGGPYAITQGNLAANSNYTLGFTRNNLIITGVAAEPILGFNVEQVVFAGVINNEFYYRPGNFWHISLNPNNADPGFDVMRGTNDLNSRLSRNLNRCDSVFGGGFCETWSFPQQFEKVDEE